MCVASLLLPSAAAVHPSLCLNLIPVEHLSRHPSATGAEKREARKGAALEAREKEFMEKQLKRKAEETEAHKLQARTGGGAPPSRPPMHSAVRLGRFPQLA